MQVMAEPKKINTELIEQVKRLLSENKWKQRDLFFALRNAGVSTSETKVSNRLKGISNFSEEEIKVINKIFKSKLKVA